MLYSLHGQGRAVQEADCRAFTDQGLRRGERLLKGRRARNTVIDPVACVGLDNGCHRPRLPAGDCTDSQVLRINGTGSELRLVLKNRIRDRCRRRVRLVCRGPEGIRPDSCRKVRVRSHGQSGTRIDMAGRIDSGEIRSARVGYRCRAERVLRGGCLNLPVLHGDRCLIEHRVDPGVLSGLCLCHRCKKFLKEGFLLCSRKA